MSKWIINGNTFDWNPSADTWWLWEEVVSSHHPAGASYDVIQSGGWHNGTRTIKGMIQSRTLHDNLMTAQTNRAIIACTDSDGAPFNARIMALRWNMRTDLTNPANNYVTYEYELTLALVA